MASAILLGLSSASCRLESFLTVRPAPVVLAEVASCFPEEGPHLQARSFFLVAFLPATLYLVLPATTIASATSEFLSFIVGPLKLLMNESSLSAPLLLLPLGCPWLEVAVSRVGCCCLA